MKAYGSYVQTLERLYLDVTRRGPEEGLPGEVTLALDGEAGRQLRLLVPVDELRAAGAFFTGSDLAAKAAARLMPSITRNSRILDPACGAGDLLVSCAKHLPVRHGFRATLTQWGRCLLGRDLEETFVAAARYRLTLAALSRGRWPRGEGSTTDPELFDQVIEGCGLRDREAVGQATHLIINPPFGLVAAPAGCEWTSGKVSAAALFLDECLRNAATGTRVVAILPDVLRSGDRYRRWRDRVTSRARVESVDLLGQFDRYADIDVFLLELVVTRTTDPRPDRWQFPAVCGYETVGDSFQVSVGPVIPYRHPERGPRHGYLHARGVPAWGIVEEVRERRRFQGTVHMPPFVVVRRTSRVGDKHRAVATIISGSGTMAVENHLLVLRPKDGQLSSCERLLGVLRSEKTDEWLNRRIRCRHLTVDAVRLLPLWKEGV
jgi:hypothetical protein